MTAKKGKNFHCTFTLMTLLIVLHWLKSKLSPEKPGELYRQALITGLIMHQLDERIPAVLTALFTRELNADEVISYDCHDNRLETLLRRFERGVESVGRASEYCFIRTLSG